MNTFRLLVMVALITATARASATIYGYTAITIQSGDIALLVHTYSDDPLGDAWLGGIAAELVWQAPGNNGSTIGPNYVYLPDEFDAVAGLEGQCVPETYMALGRHYAFVHQVGQTYLQVYTPECGDFFQSDPGEDE